MAADVPSIAGSIGALDCLSVHITTIADMSQQFQRKRNRWERKERECGGLNEGFR
jgi:hypothetical protein